METKLTHWKKLVNPDFIGAYVLEPGKDLILTIKTASVEKFKGQDGKEQEGIILRFVEDSKPMILNRTNAKTVTKIHKTPYIEQWSGKQIQVYARQIRAFGEDMEALRIRDFVPQPKQLDVTDALKRLDMCKNLDDLKTVYSRLTKEEQSNTEVIAKKDGLKTTLK